MPNGTEIRKSEKLPSTTLHKDDIKLLVKTIDNIVVPKRKRIKNIYREINFEIESSVKLAGQTYDLKENNVDKFFDSELMEPELSNLIIRWNVYHAEYDKHNKIKNLVVRRITIIFTKSDASVKIIGESLDWVDHAFSSIKNTVKRKKTKNDVYSNAVRIFFAVSILFLVPLFAIDSNIVTDITDSIFYFIVGGFFGLLLYFLLGEIFRPLDILPYTQIIIEPSKVRENWLKKMIIIIVGLIVGGIIETVIGTIILRLLGWSI